jgi:cytoskeletal protein CcmA (bactofilin family)
VSYFSQPKTGREKSGGTGTEVSSGTTAPVVAQRPAAALKANDMVSTFGPGTLITGNIVCDGAAEIFGHVIGDIQAAQVAVGDGARVEGNITANDIAINGTFKGTIRGQNVKLKGAAAVDGEIFSKSLTVEENVQFEGLSRRLDKPIELTSSAQAASHAEATSGTQAAPSVQAIPSIQPAPSVQTAPSAQATSTNGGSKPFSVASSFSQTSSGPGTY